MENTKGHALMKGRIFDIKKFAVHDGPGIRTTVFFKGCPLKCWWCHNPESIRPKPELVLFENKCIHCNECFQVCPQEAHEKLPDGSRVYHQELCTLCGECVEVCYAEALVMEGRDVTVDEVMVELRKDIPFYENSGGGITLSGGEPTLQREFILELLKQCKAEGLHTAMDTSGQAQWKTFEKLLPYVDLILYDLKHMDHVEHKNHTGVSNELIHENLKKIDECGIPIEVRIPIIPGINDAKENILRSTKFLTEIKNITRVELLPYHNLGKSKYVRLGMEYQLNDLEPPGKEQMNEITEWMRPSGLEVHAGE
ncbi:MAG: glycyl-radical enzyme activating protein [Candidatus Poribacteria bacterium]|jgi:pyruvate formate lyase activating enzyme|nr:glycyl-radical enzyme activating protein [Candidatus Poribacteria bacterium]MDP6961644.1 glycyl-radical enzyme activating protein [Dehalococcoidia bacterium]